MSTKLIALDCSWWEIWCKIGEAIANAARTVFGLVFGVIWEIVTWLVTEAVKFIIKTVGTIWMEVPNPNVGDAAGNASPAVDFLQGRVMWLAFACATMSVIIAGIRMAWTMRGEPVRDLGKSLMLFMIVSVFGVAMVAVLTNIGDGFAQWVIDDPGGGDTFDERVDQAFDRDWGGSGEWGVPGPKLILVLLIGGLAIVASIIQIGLMFVRNGMLILLLGVLPLAAAATNTEMGKAWFRRVVGWLVAFLAYKPLAALIYGAAIRMMAEDGDWLAAATGVAMMVMALIALPALLRFVSPNTGG